MTLQESDSVLLKLCNDIAATLEHLQGVLEGGDTPFVGGLGGAAALLVATVAFADAVDQLAGATAFENSAMMAADLQASAIAVAGGEIAQTRDETACLDRFLTLASARNTDAASFVADTNNLDTCVDGGGGGLSMDEIDALQAESANDGGAAKVVDGGGSTNVGTVRAIPSQEEGRRAFNHMVWLRNTIEAYKSWRPESSDDELHRVFCDEPLALLNTLKDKVEMVRCATLAGLDDSDGTTLTQDEVCCLALLPFLL